MKILMEKLKLFNVLLIIAFMSVERTCVVSCPVTCSCRGKSVKCGSGNTGFPVGIDSSTTFVSVSGSDSTHNTISSINRADITNLKSLFTLIISYSDVQMIGTEAFADLANLHDLSFADNKLKSLTADAFKGLSKLRTLDISGNKGCRFDKSTFSYISQIEELNLGGMDIMELETDVFTPLTKLKALRLYSNRLQTLDPDVMTPLNNLQIIDLTANELVGLSVKLQPKLSKLSSLHLSENPWQCNCQLKWIQDLPNAFVSNGIDNSDVICHGPDKLKYASVMNVPDKDFLCVPPKVLRCDSDVYSVDVNHNIAISCDFDGDPIPEVKWSRGSGFEIDGRKSTAGNYRIYNNGTLLITGVKETDDGDWIVTAYNETASDKHTVHVTVTGITTTTKSTTTTTTTTTTPSTTTRTTTPIPTSTSTTSMTTKSTIKSTSAALSAVPATSVVMVKTTALRQTGSSIFTIVSSPEPSLPSKKDQIIAKNGINYGLLAAAFAAGGTLVGTCFICVMCCKRKQNSEKNKIAAFEDDL